jgi:hypothetical protein
MSNKLHISILILCHTHPHFSFSILLFSSFLLLLNMLSIVRAQPWKATGVTLAGAYRSYVLSYSVIRTIQEKPYKGNHGISWSTHGIQKLHIYKNGVKGAIAYFLGSMSEASGRPFKYISIEMADEVFIQYTDSITGIKYISDQVTGEIYPQCTDPATGKQAYPMPKHKEET